jgi:type IV pilus assembly protein PilB
MRLKKKVARIGEILVSRGVIDEAMLEDALKRGKRARKRLGEVLLELGLVDEEKIAHALAEQYYIPFISFKNLVIDPKTLELIPEEAARRYKVIPVSVKEGALQVAMVDPVDVIAVDEIKRLSGLNIHPAVTTEKELMRAIDQFYGMGGTVEEIAKRVKPGEAELLKEETEQQEKLKKVAEETSIVQLVNTLISQAIAENASDIHVEPDKDTMRVRMRIDGVLYENTKLPLNLHPAVISRVKILGDLNIAEKRLPQDGRFFARMENRDIDVRVSTMPTIFGEKAVLRLLDKEKMILDFGRLTPFPDSLGILKKLIKSPFGIILLTGPTGSGKTTTAYTLLNILNTMDKNIVTIEDPVEYNLQVVNQIQINPKVGMVFANALRHILRQDPDIIMVGEVRDKETADMAIRAALTGHLVISTIHTNDAVGTITRLLDMGIEPFLVASSIVCTVGQRLVRSICPDCIVSYEPERAEVEELGINLAPNEKVPLFYKGEGCPACKGKGLKGRIGLFEVFVVEESVRSPIAQRKDTTAILDAAKKKGFKSLRAQGIRAVLEGYTTVGEVLLSTQLSD